MSVRHPIIIVAGALVHCSGSADRSGPTCAGADSPRGILGAALATRLLDLGWVERMRATRAVRVTNAGRRALRREFDVMLG
jgi:hypothetical protein